MPIHLPIVSPWESESPKRPIETVRSFAGKRAKGKICHGDAIEFLRSLKRETADIIFLDPPFNLGKVYDEAAKRLDKKREKDYVRWMEDVLDECIRVLRPGGALYLYHVPRRALLFGAYLMEHLAFQHWIAVSMKNGFVRGRRLYPAHYALLFFTKGTPRRLRRPKVKPALCRHCKKQIKDYGGYAGIIARNKGVNLTDFWEDLAPVRHAKFKTRAANELPGLMTRRIIEISGIKDGVFVDPFAGSGSAIINAVNGHMRFVGCDIVSKNCSLIVDRIVTEVKQNRGTR